MVFKLKKESQFNSNSNNAKLNHRSIQNNYSLFNLRPNFQLQPFDLTNLIQQFPAPFMIMSDFKAHNTLFGSEKIKDKGRKIQDVIYHISTSAFLMMVQTHIYILAMVLTPQSILLL